jgi:hypothetical protein
MISSLEALGLPYSVPSLIPGIVSNCPGKSMRSIGRDDDNFLSALFTFCNCVVENRSYRGLLNYMRVGFVLHVDSSK